MLVGTVVSEIRKSNRNKKNFKNGYFHLSRAYAYKLVAQLVERSPRTRSVMGLNPTQGSFFYDRSFAYTMLSLKKQRVTVHCEPHNTFLAQ